MSAPPLDVSIVVPVYNEAGSLVELHRRISEAMAGTGRSHEVLFVDDGSRDGSGELLDRISASDPHVRVLHFRRNYGQTAAISAGLEHARGRVIVPMDADLQNDPADVPLLLAKLGEGHDVVSGWRKDRQDAAITRVVPSRIANAVISRISGVPLHDYGCTLKAYRREVMEGVRLYGEMHRFIPIYASWQGARVTEMAVRHHARTKGKSKYGIGRTWRVVLDLLVVKFLASYSTKPIHVFGGFGLACFGLSFLAGAAAVWLKYWGDPPRSFIQTPLPLLTVLLIVLGFLSILMGLLAELIIRTYYEARGQRPYSIASHVQGSDVHPGAPRS
jgi:glycosyltransferase involved in cell wall biosynthesis